MNTLRRSPIKRTPFGEKRREDYLREADFQAIVEGLARLRGWWPMHIRNTKESPAGYPDLTLFRERVVFIELKTRSPKTGRAGKLSPFQVEMAHRCFAAKAEYYTWLWPDDRAAVEAFFEAEIQ